MICQMNREILRLLGGISIRIIHIIVGMEHSSRWDRLTAPAAILVEVIVTEYRCLAKRLLNHRPLLELFVYVGSACGIGEEDT